MPDDFLKVEETINSLLNELTKIRSANDQISELEKISKETIKITDNANKTSSELISRAKNIFDQIEKAKLETNLKFILEQLRENKKIDSKNSLFLIIVVVIQVIILSFIIVTKYI